MSLLGTKLRDTVADLADAMDRRSEFEPEVLGMFDAIATRMLTEKRLADDRHETVCRKLDEVLSMLGTNGSGGHA